MKLLYLTGIKRNAVNFLRFVRLSWPEITDMTIQLLLYPGNSVTPYRNQCHRGYNLD